MNKTAPLKHSDGSLCPEGTQSLPSRFKACCSEFTARTSACDVDIRYEWWPRYRGWYILISPSAGGGGIEIKFCPHCGAELRRRKKSDGAIAA
jgi:hypothetical protein